MSKPPNQSSFDYYTEDAQKVAAGIKNLKVAFVYYSAKWGFPIAAIYGAAAMSAYYFVLGTSGTILFWWLQRRIAANAKASHELNPEIRDGGASERVSHS